MSSSSVGNNGVSYCTSGSSAVAGSRTVVAAMFVCH